MKPNEPDSGESLQNKARREALLSAVGLWGDRPDLPDTQAYVRSLRKGDRLKRLAR